MYKYSATGQFRNTIATVAARAAYHKIEAPLLEFEGTVKLHGTNSSVACDYDKNVFITQSRQQIISPQKDNNGFATFAQSSSQKKAIELLLKNIKTLGYVPPDHTAVLYGEWCGGGIKKGMAITGLPRMWVLFAVKITPTQDISTSNFSIENQQEEQGEGEEEKEEGLAQDPSVYLTRADIEAVIKATEKELSASLSTLQLYSAYQFPTWRIHIDMSNPVAAQKSLEEITQSVEDKCPVGVYFGKLGLGEGVVWCCVSAHPQIKTADLKFKTKGLKHAVVKTKTIAPLEPEKVASIQEFVDKVATPERLAQGIDYLRELHLEIRPPNIGAFLKWFANDCLKEEGDTLLASGLEKKDVTGALNKKGKDFFIEQIALLAEAQSPGILKPRRM